MVSPEGSEEAIPGRLAATGRGFADRYLAEYARRPVNLVLLVVVPVVFVALSAGVVADFAKLLGGVGDTMSLEAATAGWAAAFLASVAGLFHVLGSRDADRRLALSGTSPRRIVAAGLASGLVLALLPLVGRCWPWRSAPGSVTFPARWGRPSCSRWSTWPSARPWGPWSATRSTGH
jgi:hypothetical protein